MPSPCLVVCMDQAGVRLRPNQDMPCNTVEAWQALLTDASSLWQSASVLAKDACDGALLPQVVPCMSKLARSRWFKTDAVKQPQCAWL